MKLFKPSSMRLAASCALLAALAACGGGGGGGSAGTSGGSPGTGGSSANADSTALATALLQKFDASRQSAIPTTGAAASEFSDSCSLSNGLTKAATVAAFDANSADAIDSVAFSVGSTRTNLQILVERDITNPDGSQRKEIDISYAVNYTDGSIDNQVLTTLITGSSQGSCATPQVGAEARFFGNRNLVDIFVQGRVIRTAQLRLRDGTTGIPPPVAGDPASVPLTYRREVRFGMTDPAGVATYAVVTGPGPANQIAGGTTQTFSLKLISPKVLRINPEFAGRTNVYKNISVDDNTWRMCALPTGTFSSAGVPIASAADCTGANTTGASWGVGLINSDFSATTVSARDTQFANYGFVAGGAYTFAIYNDDGWKTVNGQAGKTPIATYITTLEKLSLSFADMNITTTPANDNFPKVSSTSTTFAVAAAITSAADFSATTNWTAPSGLTGGDAYRLSNLSTFSFGAVRPLDGSAPASLWPAYEVDTISYPGSSALTGSITVPAAATSIYDKRYGEFTVTYSNRNSGRIVSLVTFN